MVCFTAKLLKLSRDFDPFMLVCARFGCHLTNLATLMMNSDVSNIKRMRKKKQKKNRDSSQNQSLPLREHDQKDPAFHFLWCTFWRERGQYLAHTNKIHCYQNLPQLFAHSDCLKRYRDRGREGEKGKGRKYDHIAQYGPPKKGQ